MLSGLFNTKPPLDEESVQWIFEVFTWGLQHLGRERFFDDTLLVTPDNKHFPGRASSIPEVAGLIFRRTVTYAGMSHWPLALREPGAALPDQAPRIEIPSPLRIGAPLEEDAGQLQVPAVVDGEVLGIGYDPNQVNNPEAMIAGFVQVLAHYLGAAVPEDPPGGIQNWPQTTEVLGVFLGFGVLFANTAYKAPAGGCGSCGGPPTQRQVYLSQYDVTYALALFCVLKSIPSKAVLGALRGSLRGYFKRCRKDIERRSEAVAGLREASAAQGLEN